MNKVGGKLNNLFLFHNNLETTRHAATQHINLQYSFSNEHENSKHMYVYLIQVPFS